MCNFYNILFEHIKFGDGHLKSNEQ